MGLTGLTSMQETQETQTTPAIPMNPFEELTPRELEVAHALALGIKNSDIATALGISTKTVDTHRSNIMSKLSCASNVGLARLALRFGVVSLDEQP